LTDSAKAAARPYLSIESVSKRFGDFTALSDVSLEVFEGEFVCFLGPSGCGKTTLLRAIAGLDIQTSGRIEQAGVDISALPPDERDFGIVFQSYALFPNLTVRKNVGYGLQSRGQSGAQIRARVDELLELVGLPEQDDKYPAQLSGGQQQRIALARAIATSPGLLLLDEPLSALDAKVRMYLRHEVKQLQRRLGVTTIMVTHDQEEALTMADRIVVMNQGVIEQIGAPLEVYGEPRTAFVADFIGSMNFLPAEAGGPGRLRLGDMELSAPTESAADGGELTVAVRPEDVTILEPDDAVEGHPGTVDSLEFLGSFVRASVITGTKSPVRMLVDVSTNRARRLGLTEGGDIRLSVPEDRIRVYPGRVARE
jgi:iron(III) transport system ATP-binding protein